MASNSSKLAQEIINYTLEIKKLQVELSKLKKGTAEYELTNRKLTATIELGKKANERYLLSLSKLNKNIHIQNIAFQRGNKVVSDFNGAIQGSGRTVLATAVAFGKTIATVGKFFLAYQALNAVLTIFREITFGAFQAFVQFEGALGRVQAVTNATAPQMKNLSEAIQNTAVETKFTSSEIAELSVSLGKLGATAEEIPNLIKPIASAAQAIGEDLASVGESILKANNQFGISSENSAVTAAILTDAVTKSALSLTSFNTALQYVGPLASQVGLELDQTSGYMKVLADNGFTASKIGTGLRNIFIRLKESGKPLTETLRELADSNIGLAQAVDLVGVRSAAQLVILLENIDSLEDYTTASEAVTDALKAQSAQMSTTESQLDMLKTAYENIKISIGEAINSNELLIEILGILDGEAEKLARTSIALNKVLSDPAGAELFESTLSRAATKGVNPMVAAMELLIATGNSADNEFIQFFKALRKDLKLSERDALNVAEAFSKSQSVQTQKAIKEELGLQGAELRILNDLFGEYGGAFSTLDEGYDAVSGISDAIETQAATLRSLNLEREIGEKIALKYRESIKQIAIDEENGLLVTDRVERLRKQILADKQADVDLAEQMKQNLQAEIEKYYEMNGGVKTLTDTQLFYVFNQERAIANLEIGIKKYDDQIDAVKELGQQEEANRKALLSGIKEKEQGNITELKSRLDSIKEQANAVEELRKKEIESAKEVFELKKLNRQNLAVAQAEYDTAVQEANDKASESYSYLASSLFDVSQEANEFRNSLKESLKAIGLDEQQADAIAYTIYEKIVIPAGDARGALEEMISSIDPTEFERLKTTLGLASVETSKFTEDLKELKKEYGRNADESKKFEAAQENLKAASIANLKALREQIKGDSEAATVARSIIDGQIEAIENGGVKIKSVGQIATEVFKETFVDAVNTALNAINALNDTAYDNTINSLNAQKEAISEKAAFEQDVLKSQLESQLISQEEYAARLEQIKKKEIARQNAIDEKIFEEEKKKDKQDALSNYLSALASIVPNLITNEGKAEPTSILIMQAITGALATASYAAQIKAIDKRRFFKKRFAEGGMVYGPSHEQGGIPFTVQGRSGYEMEGGEYIVNKKAAAKYRSLLDQINETKFQPSYKFATGGVVNVEDISMKQLDLLEAIAEATTGTAINTGRPVRAFVSSSDLQNDTNARRIKDRNSNI